MNIISRCFDYYVPMSLILTHVPNPLSHGKERDFGQEPHSASVVESIKHTLFYVLPAPTLWGSHHNVIAGFLASIIHAMEEHRGHLFIIMPCQNIKSATSVSEKSLPKFFQLNYIAVIRMSESRVPFLLLAEKHTLAQCSKLWFIVPP